MHALKCPPHLHQATNSSVSGNNEENEYPESIRAHSLGSWTMQQHDAGYVSSFHTFPIIWAAKAKGGRWGAHVLLSNNPFGGLRRRQCSKRRLVPGAENELFGCIDLRRRFSSSFFEYECRNCTRYTFFKYIFKKNFFFRLCVPRNTTIRVRKRGKTLSYRT